MGRLENFLVRRSFREMQALERLVEKVKDRARVDIVSYADHKGLRFPLYRIVFGPDDPKTPVLAFFGGVHGLEKIGSEILLSYMDQISTLLDWDEALNERLAKSRLLFYPIANPVGIVLRRRANGNGIDIMRNAPIDAEIGPLNPIFSGHRISSRLPWYRGQEGDEMETETKAMIQVIEQDLLPSSLALSVDLHSGFGVRDQFWFPYARSKEPFPYLAEVTALKNLFDRSYPHHFYQIEPVSRNYLIHGDLWDWMYDRHYLQKQAGRTQGYFFPWTLEMGSWLWLKKNPRQVFDTFGLFHPIKPHRHHRIMRRHLTLFDFLHRSVLFPRAWIGHSEVERERLRTQAMEIWYAS